MSGQEDFQSLLEILVSCVISVDIFTLIGLTKDILWNEKKPPTVVEKNDEKIKIEKLETGKAPGLTVEIEQRQQQPCIDDIKQPKIQQPSIKIDQQERSQSESKSEIIEILPGVDKTSASAESCESLTERPPLITHEDEFRNTNVQLVRSETTDQLKEEELEEVAKLGNDDSDDFVNLSYDEPDDSLDLIPPTEESASPTENLQVEITDSLVVVDETLVVKTEAKVETLQNAEDICDTDQEVSNLTALNLTETIVETTKSDIQDDSIEDDDIKSKVPVIENCEAKFVNAVETAPIIEAQLSQNVVAEHESIPNSSEAASCISDLTEEHHENEKPHETLKRTKRVMDSLDRSPSRPSSRHSQARKSPSVASEQDYKEWFDRFDNHITPNLTVTELEEHFESDEEDFLNVEYEDDMIVPEFNDIDDSCAEDSGDVSVSVTLNLKKPQDKNVSTGNISSSDQPPQRRLSIFASTEDQLQKFVSPLHPESFNKSENKNVIKLHQNHESITYHEWIKKIVDHQSSHLSTSDYDSDSDVSLDEIRMLPVFSAKHQ